MYYGAISLFRYKALIKNPLAFLDQLSKQILKTTAAIGGAIGASWGSICLFATILPRSFMPRSRFFLGGLLAGCFQILDAGTTGKGNALYAARSSADSLWKVGKKRGWWRGINGGDVYLFALSLAMINIVYEKREEAVDGGALKWLMKLLRGETGLDLDARKLQAVETVEHEKKSG